MVLEVLGGWSTGAAAVESVADAGVSELGAVHGVVGWSGDCECGARPTPVYLQHVDTRYHLLTEALYH